MTTRRVADSHWGLSLPWLAAAVLVLAGSVLVATWLHSTAVTADTDTLSRGAAAVQSVVEEQINVLQLAGTGTASMVGNAITDLDLEALVKQMDVTLLRSMVAAVIYPVGPEGVGDGAFVAPGLIQLPNLEVPSIEVGRSEIESLADAGKVYLSPPLETDGSDPFSYVLGIPSGSEDELELVAVVFRPDRMLSAAVNAAGKDQYAVELVDARFSDQLIVSFGEPSSGLSASRQPAGFDGAMQLVVRPGAKFPFSSSPWMTTIVVAVGLVIAGLLMWMGKMAQARARDFAERLRLAQELSDSKDRFLATVSHELRTPLTVVLGVAAEAGPNWDTLASEERNELLAMLSEQAGEAANIVEDLLVAARSDPSQLRLAMEDTLLRTHIDYALGSLTKAGQARVANDACDHLVHADSSRLRQILRNLLENAVRYGGERIEVECRHEGGRVVVTVSDDGDILNPEDVERIFEPYEQSADGGDRSPQGVGIGLYVSRLLARLMGGDLDCVCENGQTRFRLTLTAPQVEPVDAAEVTAVAV